MNSTALETPVSTLPLEGRRASVLTALNDNLLLGIFVLTPLVLLVHGYHPFADDAGGIYVPGIEKMMHPDLFGADAVFVVAHTRFSIFSHIFAGALKVSHLPLEIGLFAAYLASAFAFLLGCFRLTQRIFDDVQIQWGAVLLSSALFTLPVAATALWIMDPYVTARSFSTPFSLFALAACMDRRWKSTAFWFLLTAAMHPLMAAYLATFLFAYVLVSGKHWRLLGLACLAGFLAAGAIYMATCHDAVPYGYQEAVLTRQYFFLSRWRWFEWMGLVMPLLLMLLATLRSRAEDSAVSNLCITCIATGTTAILSAACFVHTSGSFFLARLQFLRSFQLIYIVGVLLLGGFLARYLSGPRAALGALGLVSVSALMLFVQNQSYTTSAHIEWPFAAAKNQWQQAFLWVRRNTPEDAVFAIDPEYTSVAAEDTQGFRTMAQRSVLVDDLKDGGVVAMFPALAPQWKKERDLESGLDRMSDEERTRRFGQTSVTWLLLSADSRTQLPCPYRNSAVAVCRLR